ncbi:MAG TPA: GspH/FimT family pseudopilin [Burkholderiales bacterium]|nr:GspH/FimT family pseudopilin [Burkholderiales bacterium]
MSRARGFSLLELVVVIVIAAILAALAIPRFTDSESRTGWYHEQVKAGIRYAQRQAVAQRRPVFVDVASSQITLCYSLSAGTCDAGARLQQLASGQPYVLEAPDGVTLAPTGVFSFDALGQSGGYGLAVGGRAITVNAGTGYVE